MREKLTSDYFAGGLSSVEITGSAPAGEGLEDPRGTFTNCELA